MYKCFKSIYIYISFYIWLYFLKIQAQYNDPMNSHFYWNKKVFSGWNKPELAILHFRENRRKKKEEGKVNMEIQMRSWCFIDFLFSTIALRTLSRNVHQEKCFSVTPSFKSWPLSVGNQNKNFPGRVHFHFQVGLSHWKGCVWRSLNCN